MPYITREDGEHFVIPAYRDVLSYANKTQLKKDIIALSEKYGQYITLQKKGPKYEAAFSPDPGYLLGESVWVHFKRPLDMVYCEAVQNKSEAILVVVKEGSIYLDGQFPLDGIAEELIVFLTQQNQFAIYTYGDVPISKEPEDGKFCFDPSAVRSFEELSEPVFPLIKPNKNYQLRLVDVVLKAHHIGVFPTAQVVSAIFLILFSYIGYYLYTEYRSAMIETFIPPPPPPPNPYSDYQKAMKSPSPRDVIYACLAKMSELSTMPGWVVNDITCSGDNVQATVVTQLGGSLELLNAWLSAHGYSLTITASALQVSQSLSLPNRAMPSVIYPLQSGVIRIMDDIMRINSTNAMNLSLIEEKAARRSKENDVVANDKVHHRTMTLKLDNASPFYFGILAERMADMPVVISTMKLTFTKGVAEGLITFDVLGT